MNHKEKIIEINKTKISYFDNEKNDCLQILFIHGNSSTKDTFKKQLSSQELSNFRLIALDLPGHGSSARNPLAINDSNIYSLSYHTNIINMFIEKLKLNNLILVGHSLGGHIATLSASKLNPFGLITFQTPPIEIYSDIPKCFNSIPFADIIFIPNITKEQVVGLFHETFLDKTKITDDLIDSFLNTDPLCRQNLGASLTPEYSFNEVTNLTKYNGNKAIFYGENDQLINGDYIKNLKIRNLWQEKIISIPNAGHYPHIEASNFFNTLLEKFSSQKIKENSHNFSTCI